MARQKASAQAVIFYPDRLYDKYGRMLETATIIAEGNGELARRMTAGMVRKLGELYARSPTPLNVECDANFKRLCICQTVPAVSPQQVAVCAESLRRALQKVGIRAITSPTSLGEIERFRNPL